jgi:spoIIIJ-associated protein
VEEIERSAASVEEAIEAALGELGVSEQEAEIEILQEPRSGFLGINSQPAIVRVRASSPAREVESGEEEESDRQADLAADFLQGLIDAMRIDVEVEVGRDHGIAYVDLWGAEDGEDAGLLIGKRGHTLEALQELVRCHIQRETGDRCMVLVDVEDYRKRRRSQLVRTAREAAQRVQRTGKPESLEPMSASDRKLVHDTVGQVTGLETASEGEEPRRFVVIRPAR